MAIRLLGRYPIKEFGTAELNYKRCEPNFGAFLLCSFKSGNPPCFGVLAWINNFRLVLHYQNPSETAIHHHKLYENIDFNNINLTPPLPFSTLSSDCGC